MQDIFITKIHIDKVRHLENIDIPLSENQKKHLIITGKNGSGKTSLLDVLADKIKTRTVRLENEKKVIVLEDKHLDVTVHYNILPKEGYNWIEADCILVYIPAERTLKLDLPKTIEAVDLSIPIDSNELASKTFIKYMLHLNYQKMVAQTNGDQDEAIRITNWFNFFTDALREIYGCPELQLKHNSKDLSFKIHMPDRDPFGLNEMAYGYSSFLNVVIELMMRMESDASMIYDLPGIVLIDEIEAHMHVELQKQVFPFLTKMFPRIQFIVTTHSPFVITSISNAVVFDLERKVAIEDMSAYSYEGVIEHYYDISMNSIEADKQFQIYKSLVDKQSRTDEETEQLVDAITYLKQIPAGAAEELVFAFREMEEKRRQRVNGKAQ